MRLKHIKLINFMCVNNVYFEANYRFLFSIEYISRGCKRNKNTEIRKEMAKWLSLL